GARSRRRARGGRRRGGSGGGQQGRKVVVERERGRVGRVARAVRAEVARAEIAGGIVRREAFLADGFDLSQPRTRQAVGRAEDPLVGQRVVTPMGSIAHSGIRPGCRRGRAAGLLPPPPPPPKPPPPFPPPPPAPR